MVIRKLKKAISNLYRIDSIVDNKLIILALKSKTLYSTECGISDRMITDKPIIVSLTTYGKKIYDVYLTIESIFQQTIKPNKVVLWISKDEFSSENLPVTLKNQIGRALDVRFCKDIRSYTKLVYSLREFKGCHIISIDDDIVYPFDMIENFIVAYQEDNKKIYFNKGHKILYDTKNERIKPYIEWCKDGYIEGSSLQYLPLGVYGIFYPDGILAEEVVNEEVFLEISPTADDIWFKAMSLLNNVECAVVQQGAMVSNGFISTELDRETALARTNVDQGANDWQIQKIFEQYNLFKILDNDEGC